MDSKVTKTVHLVVGMTGATGVVLGIRLLEELKRHQEIHTHLIMSGWARKVIEIEKAMPLEKVRDLADYHYEDDDLAAPLTSGSFLTEGMVIVPCTADALADVANGYSKDLISRAAAVTLKERRKLVLVVRETPLSIIHLENMLKAARAGAVILPPVLTFYHKPSTIDDVADYVVGKILDLFGIEHKLFRRWGIKS